MIYSITKEGRRLDYMSDEFGRDLLAYWLRLNRKTARAIGARITKEPIL